MIKEYQNLFAAIIIAVGCVVGGWLIAQNRRYQFVESDDDTSSAFRCYDLNTAEKWSVTTVTFPGTAKFKSSYAHRNFKKFVEEHCEEDAAK